MAQIPSEVGRKMKPTKHIERFFGCLNCGLEKYGYGKITLPDCECGEPFKEFTEMYRYVDTHEPASKDEYKAYIQSRLSTAT